MDELDIQAIYDRKALTRSPYGERGISFGHETMTREMTIQDGHPVETKGFVSGQRSVSSVNAESVNNRAKLIMHRLIARRLSTHPELVTQARERLQGSKESAPDYVQDWQAVLDSEIVQLCRLLGERSELMYRLRLSSPFVGAIDFRDPDLRRRLYRKARSGIHAHTLS